MFISTKQKTIITLILLIACIVVLIWIYYFKILNHAQMGGLNINKFVNVNKLSTSTIYSDFYYRITKYDEGDISAEFSSLIPVKTSLRYDFKNWDATQKTLPTITLDATKINSNDIIHLLSNNDYQLSPYIKEMKKFSEIYAEIFATQDSDFIHQSNLMIKTLIKRLLNINFSVPNTCIKSFYKIFSLPAISNVSLNYYKNNQMFTFVRSSNLKEWFPHIIDFKTNENDEVFITYLKQFKNENVDSYVKKHVKKVKFHGYIISTVKINNNKVKKLYILINNKKPNELISYIMDASGYLYLIKLRTKNKIQSVKNISKFLQLLYGLKIQGQIKADKYKDKVITNRLYITRLRASCENYEDYKENYNDLKKYGLVQFYNLPFITIDDLHCKDSKLDKVTFLKYFKKMWGEYPSKQTVSGIKDKINLITKVYKKLSEQGDYLTFRNSTKAKILKKKYPTLNSILK